MPDSSPDTPIAPPSRSRRLAREVAFQAIYMSMVGGVDIDNAIDIALERHHLAEDAEAFVREIVGGVRENVDDLDTSLELCLAAGWTIDRLAISDLVVLRIATFELLKLPEMPPKVTISQAVDLAARFGTKDSGMFVNGVLGTLLNATDKAEWESPIVVDEIPDSESEFVESASTEDDAAEEEIEGENVKAGSWVIKRDTTPSE